MQVDCGSKYVLKCYFSRISRCDPGMLEMFRKTFAITTLFEHCPPLNEI